MRIGDLNHYRRILTRLCGTRLTAKVALLDGFPTEQAAVLHWPGA